MVGLQQQIAAYAEGKSKRKSERPRWRPVQVGDLAVGPVMAFDQTIAKTAWVYVLSRGDAVCVLEHGMCRQPPVPDKVGFEDTLTRATWLGWQIDEALVSRAPSVVVHEMPAVSGHRVDSSLLAALAIRIAADRRHIPVKMVSAQAVKKLLTGSANAEKAQVRAALVTLVGSQKRWNEDLYDALGLAVTFLHQRKAKGHG